MELVAAIEARKAQLLDFVRQEREMRLRALREQMTLCTARLQQTTALLQFCIEALKETDSVSFLQVSVLIFFLSSWGIGILYGEVLITGRGLFREKYFYCRPFEVIWAGRP